MLKICAFASTYDLPAIWHGHSTPASAHLTASQPPNLCPRLEYLVKWNEIHQFFLATPLKPSNGMIRPPDIPGLGIVLDESNIDTPPIVRWTD
jgi:L-rhamnonate dehydratase